MIQGMRKLSLSSISVAVLLGGAKAFFNAYGTRVCIQQDKANCCEIFCFTPDCIESTEVRYHEGIVQRPSLSYDMMEETRTSDEVVRSESDTSNISPESILDESQSRLVGRM